MVRIAICDDMQLFLDESVKKIEQWEKKPEDLIIDLFTDGDALIESHSAKPYDIILLDIVMPLMNGIDAASEIRKNDKAVKIVFLTTSTEFAIDAFEVHASNYLLKPINDKKLFACLEELFEEITDKEKTINIRSTNTVHHIALHDIEYLEAQGKKVLIVLSNGKVLESTNPFYYYEELLLGEEFYKCHRSYMVNLYRIASFNATEAKMNSGARIPISRNCRGDFEKSYFELFFGDKKEGNLK